MTWRISGKNSSDIRICLDCIKLALSNPEIDEYVLVSGDVDFVNLVRDLKKLGKRVIGMSPELSSSNMLKRCCDEFIILTDADSAGQKHKNSAKHIKDIINDLFEKKGKDKMNIGQLKEHILQIDNTFTEANYGNSSFSRFLHSQEYRIVNNIERSSDYFCVSPQVTTIPIGFNHVFGDTPMSETTKEEVDMFITHY